MGTVMGTVICIVVGAVLLGCAACGRNEQVGFGGAAPTTAADRTTTAQATAPVSSSGGTPDTDPMNPKPPPGSVMVPATRVDASALPPGYPTVVWMVGDGSTLGAYGQAGGCIEATADLVEQTARRVVIRITEATTSAGPCTMEIRYPPLTVTLDAPLAERTVVLQRRQLGPPR
jgi:hypothetical protein